LSPLLFNFFFATAIEVVIARFSGTTSSLETVYFDEGTEMKGQTPVERVKRAVWGVLYGDDACVASTSAEELTRTRTVVVEVFAKFGLTLSEKKTETLVTHVPGKAAKKRGSPPPRPPPMVIEAGG